MKSGTSVAPSPFNAVKLELALILLVSCVLLFVVSSITKEFLGQLLLLASFSAVSTLWLVFRIRYILSAGEKPGQQQIPQKNQTS